MTGAVRLRQAVGTDRPKLADIAYRAWENGILPLVEERPGMRISEQRRLAHAVAETLDRIVVAELEGELVGWCSRARHRPYIPFLFVSPKQQSQGIGSALLRRVESMLELEGAGAVHLETPADNVRAVRFYQRQGYRILAMRPESRTGGDAFTSVRLEKRLQPFKGRVTEED